MPYQMLWHMMTLYGVWGGLSVYIAAQSGVRVNAAWERHMPLLDVYVTANRQSKRMHPLGLPVRI